MHTTTPTISRILFIVCGIGFAVPSLFFTYYTLRLIYVNLIATAEDAAAHRTGGMLIGAIAFPVAAIIFGFMSWFYIRKAMERGHPAGKDRESDLENG